MVMSPMSGPEVAQKFTSVYKLHSVTAMCINLYIFHIVVGNFALDIDASHMSENIVKQTLWNVFSQTVDILI